MKPKKDIDYEIDLYGTLPFVYDSIRKIIDQGYEPGNIRIGLPDNLLGLKVVPYAAKKSQKRKVPRIP